MYKSFRTNIRRTAIAVMALGLTCAAIQSSPAKAEGQPALQFTKLAVQPQAIANKDYQGRFYSTDILDLAFYDDKMVAGYGDRYSLSDSTGSPQGRTAIRPFNLTTKQWGAMTYAGSESIEGFRVHNGNIYTPVSVPSENGAGGFITNKSGSWVVKNPPSMQLARGIRDLVVANGSGSEIWAFGSAYLATHPGDLSHARAVAWRSSDGGGTWRIAKTDLSDPSRPQFGGESYIWGGALNGKVYMQADGVYPQPPMRVFNLATETWSTQPVQDACFQQLDMQVFTFDGKIICNTGYGTLTAFNGTAVSSVKVGDSTGSITDTYLAGNTLYVLDWNNMLYRTTSLAGPWQKIGKIKLPMVNGTYTSPSSIAVYKGMLYVGSNEAVIWRTPLP